MGYIESGMVGSPTNLTGYVAAVVFAMYASTAAADETVTSYSSPNMEHHKQTFDENTAAADEPVTSYSSPNMEHHTQTLDDAVVSNLSDEHADEMDHGAALSESLRQTFGMNVNQWAKVMRVERKTLYHWKAKPDTKLQSSQLARLEQLNALAEELLPSHAGKLGKVIFGKNAVGPFAQVVLASSSTEVNLVEYYDKYFNEVDGAIVRLELKRKANG